MSWLIMSKKITAFWFTAIYKLRRNIHSNQHAIFDTALACIDC